MKILSVTEKCYQQTCARIFGIDHNKDIVCTTLSFFFYSKSALLVCKKYKNVMQNMRRWLQKQPSKKHDKIIEISCRKIYQNQRISSYLFNNICSFSVRVGEHVLFFSLLFAVRIGHLHFKLENNTNTCKTCRMFKSRITFIMRSGFYFLFLLMYLLSFDNLLGNSTTQMVTDTRILKSCFSTQMVTDNAKISINVIKLIRWHFLFAKKRNHSGSCAHVILHLNIPRL